MIILNKDDEWPTEKNPHWSGWLKHNVGDPPPEFRHTPVIDLLYKGLNNFWRENGLKINNKPKYLIINPKFIQTAIENFSYGFDSWFRFQQNSSIIGLEILYSENVGMEIV